MKIRILLAAFALVAALPVLVAGAGAADAPKLPSGPHPMVQDVPADPMPREIVDDVKRTRNYADQPPLIPHAIRDYQLDLNVNKCLTCHDRKNSEGAQAPMISITHFQDRDGQALGAVSPRRYFCTQCHVPQTDARPITGNMFKDIDTVLRGKEGGK
ncbi:nitrate reductase cytochrome c-type subunit [Azospirillum soli]|uniref:nitrate reductase cytochrome c-type subunit n=1 Tax=Azospirillum soli TaxID=1304799 RepID=UPI001AE406B3|nr:nitrate reductase cytochrome c-type subunit [Azospirillum soli]MBP2314251.1 cytochrome c-type protein NapB [Azospirillum soli]